MRLGLVRLGLARHATMANCGSLDDSGRPAISQTSRPSQPQQQSLEACSRPLWCPSSEELFTLLTVLNGFQNKFTPLHPHADDSFLIQLTSSKPFTNLYHRIKSPQLFLILLFSHRMGNFCHSPLRTFNYFSYVTLKVRVLKQHRKFKMRTNIRRIQPLPHSIPTPLYVNILLSNPKILSALLTA